MRGLPHFSWVWGDGHWLWGDGSRVLARMALGTAHLNAVIVSDKLVVSVLSAAMRFPHSIIKLGKSEYGIVLERGLERW